MKPYLFVVVAALLLLLGFYTQAQTVSLVSSNAAWKYYNANSAPASTWKTVSFNDASWLQGNAELGYGDGGEATVLSYGANPNKKFKSYYFRKTFTVTNPSAYSTLTLGIIRDDGAVVYLNGTEVKRTNMPTGTVSYSTMASSAIDGAAESTYNVYSLATSFLNAGTNVIAVEIHQASQNSSDVSFNLYLDATTLTCAAPTGLNTTNTATNSATINWSTVSGALSYNIQYRQQGGTNWITATSTTNAKALSGLNPATTYEYQVQTVCNGSNSSWTSSFLFTTNAVSTNPLNDTLIAANGAWKYLDNGSNAGTSWYSATFNDVTWSSGAAQLGYGDGDEAKVVSYGADANNKYITTYFRKTFNVSNPSLYTWLKMELMRDDGAVVYLNGVEMHRTNMPTTAIAYNTLATTAVANADESAFYVTNLNTTSLVAGTNVIAVEVHQNAVTSTDISFALRLLAGSGTSLTRGAYLNQVTSNSIVVRWRTSTATNSSVQYGTTLSYGSVANDASLTTEHVVTLTGLSPNTTYYYTIGSSTQLLQSGVSNKFLTAPATGSTAPIRMWVTGDFGNGSTQQAAVRDAFQNYVGNGLVNLWLWLGDNAYETGTDAEFQNKVFNVYPNQFKNIPVYPSIGNHDYGNTGYQGMAAMTTNSPYFSIFTLPANAEAGGVASGTEKYYSYNYGNVHFVVLDSYGALNNSGSPMYNWLVNDLNANVLPWTVCYFHHTPYSKGTHDSDNATESINIRQNILPVLEAHHVDLVLCGHTHYNERSFFMRGHYGVSTTFAPSMKMSLSSNYFLKSSAADGCVYVNCGTSGKIGGTTNPLMPCMVYGNGTLNSSLIIDVIDDSLHCQFLTSTGIITDQFSIVKQTSLTRFSGSDVFDTRVLPNPFSTNAVVEASWPLELHDVESATFDLFVYDVAGKLVFTESTTSEYEEGGPISFSIERNELNSGIYIYRIRTTESKTIAHGKFIIE